MLKRKQATVDVVIITHNRYEKLYRCVSYIVSGSVLPKRLIIIHSQPPDICRTKNQITNLVKKVGVDLFYKHVPHKGISYSRNEALKYIKSDWYGFLDDDEYPSFNWLQTATTLIHKYPEVAAISGPKLPACIANYWNQIWFLLIKPGLRYSGRCDFVTSSNTFYKRKFIRKNSIMYDEDFRTSSEDRVVSYKLIYKNAILLFDHRLIAYHDYRERASDFIFQWFDYGATVFNFQKKYLKKSSRANFLSVYDLLQFRKVGNKPIYLIPGCFIGDIAFFLGFILSPLLKKWN